MGLDGALIGGTGLGRHIEALPGKAMFVPTPHGMAKGKVVQWEGSEIFCIRRHSAGHSVPPHAVNYLALASALEQLGVKGCFASAAVGCLRSDWKVGDFVLCKDFIDLSARNITAFASTVQHVDFSEPFSQKLADCVIASSTVPVITGGVYANMNGPRYETPGEIEALRALGANLVGMTAASEAIALRELNVPYACVAVVTNAAAGMEEAPLDHQEVTEVMNDRGKVLLNLLLNACKRLSQS